VRRVPETPDDFLNPFVLVTVMRRREAEMAIRTMGRFALGFCGLWTVCATAAVSRAGIGRIAR